MLALSDAKTINPWSDGGKSLEAFDSRAYSRLLRRCGNDMALVEGRKIHARIAAAHNCVDSGQLGRDIVEMYLKCGSLIEARSVFRELCSSSNDVALWTAMVAAFSQHGQFDESFRTFQSMLQSGISIDRITLLTVFNACTKAGALEEGRRVRGYSDECGLSADTAVATAIVNLYGKCRELDDAIAVFDKTEVTRNVLTWTVMVAAYVQAGHHKEAFDCLQRMQLEGISPNEFTFVNALGSCGCGDDLARGRTLHGWIGEKGLESNPVLANALVSMYSRCGGVEEAAMVFEGVESGTRDVIMWTSMVAAYGQCGFSDTAFRMFQRMLLEGIRPDKISFITILGSLMPDRAKVVHDLVRECCFDSDVVVGTALVEMFSKAGNFSSSRDAFDRISQPVVASWSALISAMVDHGYSTVALAIFQKMLLEGVKTDKIALITILGACKSSSFLPAGKLVHSFIASSGFELDLVVANALIDMYGSCRDLEAARDIFGELVPYEDAVSWNSMIAAFTESGQHDDAMLLFHKMQLQGMTPDKVTFILVLNSFSVSKQGKGFRDLQKIHELVQDVGLDVSSEVERCLFRMFASCGFPDEAAKRCPNISQQDVGSWNTLLGAFIEHGQAALAVQRFQEMHLNGGKPNSMTLVSILNLCAKAGFLQLGQVIHCWICDCGGHLEDELVRASIIRMYGKCGEIEDAQAVFQAGEETFVSWNALVAAFADSGMAEKSLHSLHRMHLEGFQADEITLASILNACESPQDLRFGRKVHEQVVTSGWESGTVLGTAVISMYGRCGSVEDSFRAFNVVAEKDLVAMNVMITACVQHEEFGEALNLFRRMQLEGMKPSKATFVAVLNACSSPIDANFVLSCILETTSLRSYESEADLLLGNALVTMHGRRGDFAAAQQAFNAMAVMDVISWNALMVAAEKGDEVLQIFHQMQQEGFRPNKVSFVNLLTAASSSSSGSIISSTQSCKAIQSLAVQAQVSQDEVVKHGFMNLYGKIGHLNQADQVFQDVSGRDLVSWNSIIAAYARNATAARALELFLEMLLQGIAPDGITFVSILSACSHSGQAASALFYFSSMAVDYGVPAGQEHRGCLIDLFSRSGRLGLAEELSESSSGGGGGGLQWMMVLGGCQIQNDARLGKAVAERVMEMERSSAAGHVVLSNLLRAGI